MSWVCPSCGQSWPARPLVEDSIGCPECGSIGAPKLPAERLAGKVHGLLTNYRAYGEYSASDHIVAESKAALEELDELVTRLSAAEQALEAYEAAIDRHELWCGYRAEAPGDGSLNHARRLAAAALAGREETTP